MCAKGIDVSDWQDPVNWHSVARDGMGFAFTKATEGSNYVADSFRRNWDAIKAVGLARGAYHFYRTKHDPQAQAELFLRTVKLEPDDLPPVLDIESTDGMPASTIISGITHWLNVVEKQTGRRPIIYTYPSFWDRIGNPKLFSDYPLWIAHYDTNTPWVPGGWDGWTFWQYTDRGSVSGIGGGVDINWFNVCRQGGKGSHVEYIQTCLKNKGFDPGSTNGIFGSTMTTAVMDFQRAMNLEVDGIVGINTWRALMSLTKPQALPKPAPTPPAPTPAPVFPPRQPSEIPAIMLLDVCRFYKGFSHQNRALQWLQGQLSTTTLQELARRWRGQSVGQSESINLVELCKYYQGLPIQDQAVQWLQWQLPNSTLAEFARQWRSAPEHAVSQSTSISLIDVCTYYQSFVNQKRALEWLQGQIQSSILSEFSRQWRNQKSLSQSASLSLIDVCQYYQGLIHQKQAIEWLQTQLKSSTLDEFTRKWRS